jgi:hypothetical protein
MCDFSQSVSFLRWKLNSHEAGQTRLNRFPQKYLSSNYMKRFH